MNTLTKKKEKKGTSCQKCVQQHIRWRLFEILGTDFYVNQVPVDGAMQSHHWQEPFKWDCCHFNELQLTDLITGHVISHRHTDFPQHVYILTDIPW